jgi:hypothetical protein
MSQASSGDKNRTTIVKNHEMVPNEADSRVETDNTSRVYDFAGPLPLLVPQVEKSTHEWRAHRYFGAKFQYHQATSWVTVIKIRVVHLILWRPDLLFRPIWEYLKMN